MLNSEMRDLLAKASVVAEAPASGALDSSPGIAHMKAGTVEPRSTTGRTLLERMAVEFDKVRSEEDARQAVAWAEKALQDAQRAPAPPKELLEKGTLPWKRHIAKEMLRVKGSDKLSHQIVGEICRVNECSRASAYRFAVEHPPKQNAA